MDLRQLRQFVALAEEGSFSLAAQRLHMAQPPLSVAIRKLEDDLGVTLFLRGPRGVALTAAGTAALDAARRCLDAAANVRVVAQQAETGETGHLRMGFSGSVTVRLLPRLVRAFGERHPAVRLELREGTNMELLSLVESRTLDLALVRLPTTRPSDVRFQPVEQDTFCLALPRGHALAKKRTVPLRDLDGQPFIAYAPSSVGGLHAAASRVLQLADVAPRVTQEAVQVQTVLGLVASGLGLALVPAANTPFQGSSGAVFRRLDGLPKEPSIGIALAWHHLNENPALLRFIALVEADAFPA